MIPLSTETWQAVVYKFYLTVYLLQTAMVAYQLYQKEAQYSRVSRAEESYHDRF